MLRRRPAHAFYGVDRFLRQRYQPECSWHTNCHHHHSFWSIQWFPTLSLALGGFLHGGCGVANRDHYLHSIADANTLPSKEMHDANALRHISGKRVIRKFELWGSKARHTLNVQHV